MTNATAKIPAIKSTTNADHSVLELEFAHGQVITLYIDGLNDDITAQATAHGLKQKLVDAAAISRNPLTGQSATIEDKYEAVKAVFDRITDFENGTWNAVREGGNIVGGLLLKALVRLYDGRKTVDELKEFLTDKTDAEKSALRKNAKIAAIILEIQAEKAEESGIDADSLLDELDD